MQAEIDVTSGHAKRFKCKDPISWRWGFENRTLFHANHSNKFLPSLQLISDLLVRQHGGQEKYAFRALYHACRMF